MSVRCARFGDKPSRAGWDYMDDDDVLTLLVDHGAEFLPVVEVSVIKSRVMSFTSRRYHDLRTAAVMRCAEGSI